MKTTSNSSNSTTKLSARDKYPGSSKRKGNLVKKKFVVGGVLFMFSVLFLASWLLPIYSHAAPYDYTKSAVYITTTAEEGHGTGIYIGDNKVLTAAHVAKQMGDDKLLELQDQSGHKVTAKALWIDSAYDVALLQIEDMNSFTVEKAQISCEVPKIGDNLESVGNPGHFHFAHTWGRVSDSADKIGPWKNVFVTDMNTFPGQSGGPVFNDDHKVVGLILGALMTFKDEEGGMALSHFGLVVPGNTLCKLINGQH